MTEAVESLSSAVQYFLTQATKAPIALQHLKPWLESFGPHVLVISSDVLSQTILPAYHLLKPAHIAHEMTVLTLPRPSTGKLSLAATVVPLQPQLATDVRADDGLPVLLKAKHPELKGFRKYVKSITQPESIRFVAVIVELVEGYNYLLLTDLQTRRLEVAACVLAKLPDATAREIENAVTWFAMYRFRRRVSATPVLRSKVLPPFAYCTVISLLYSMLRIRFDFAMEKAAPAITVLNLGRFLKHFLPAPCPDDEIII